MRKINTRDFRVATRTTSRDINRRIALNLIREHQPISRADLARRMNVTRGIVSVLVQELVDQRTGRILNAPTLGWTGVDIRDRIVAMTGLPVQIENSARACALAQLWLERGDSRAHSFAYVTISDGVGVGVVINGELLRGHDYIAGEFGHLPLNVDGPRCMCGARGCWEAYTSNLAIMSRYFGWDLSELSPKVLRDSEKRPFSILELIERARAGDAKAIGALETSARFLGIGLANIVKTI